MERRKTKIRTKKLAAALILCMAVNGSLAGCGQAEKTSGASQAQPDNNGQEAAPVSSEEDAKVTLDGAEYDRGGTKVILDGVTYDLSEREPSVNAINGIQEAEGYWIVEGHISPRASYYGFCNRETGQWEKEIVGGPIAWEEPFSLDSLVYMVANELYDNNDNLVGTVDLEEEEYEIIWSLSRKGSQAEVKIQNAEIDYRIVTVDLP